MEQWKEVVASGALSALAEEVVQGRLRLNAGVSRAASTAGRVNCEEEMSVQVSLFPVLVWC